MPKPIRVFDVRVERVKRAWPISQRFRVRLVGANGEVIAVGESLANHADAVRTAELITFGSGSITDTTGLGARLE